MLGDLTDHNTSFWRLGLVRALYLPQQANDILQIPIPKSNFAQDKLMWKHSSSEEYQVNIAYDLINSETWKNSRSNTLDQVIWTKVWKVQVPLKVNTFIWKLLQDCIPTFCCLRHRAILVTTLCPLCNEEDETLTHLFLLCTFSRASGMAPLLPYMLRTFMVLLFSNG